MADDLTLTGIAQRLAGIEAAAILAKEAASKAEAASVKAMNGGRELLIRIDEQVKQLRKTDVPHIHTRLDALNGFKSSVERQVASVEKQVVRNTTTIKLLLALAIAVGTAAITNFAGAW